MRIILTVFDQTPRRGSPASSTGPKRKHIVGDIPDRDAKSSGRAQIAGEFSERDPQILGLVAQGCSNEEISEALFISSGMVKKYVASLMQRLQVDNRVKLAVFAHKAGVAK